jgi:predicted membrane protein
MDNKIMEDTTPFEESSIPFSFRPTWFTFAILFLIIVSLAWFFTKITIALFIFVVLWYQLSKKVTPDIEKEETNSHGLNENEQNKLRIQAEQIEEIATSPTIELFPDIKAELLKFAAEKYGLIENEEKVTNLLTKAAIL